MSASINLIPLSALQAAGIPENKIWGHPMEVTGFRGRANIQRDTYNFG